MWNPKKRKPVGPRAANQNPPAPRRNPALRAGEVMNSDLAEPLAVEAEKARPPLTRAFRRASRRAFLWPEEAKDMVLRGRPCRTPGHWAISRKDFEEMDRSP